MNPDLVRALDDLREAVKTNNRVAIDAVAQRAACAWDATHSNPIEVLA